MCTSFWLNAFAQYCEIIHVAYDCSLFIVFTTFVVWIYWNFFTHSSVDGHLLLSVFYYYGCVLGSATLTSVLMNIHISVGCVDLPSHRLHINSALLLIDTAKQFSEVVVSVYASASCVSDF